MKLKPTTPLTVLTAGTTSKALKRKVMNGKPVLTRAAKTVISDSAEFREKGLCDGLIYNPGDACAFSCTFCYVGSVMRYVASPVIKEYNTCTSQCLGFGDVVIRREDALTLLIGQLLTKSGKRRFKHGDNRMLFTSSAVDIAANLELLSETAEACNLILEHTDLQIRLLSKSSLLHRLIADNMIPERHHQRLVFGFSTGTLDDKVAGAIEKGTAKVSKRIESLHWLQDRGFRTFGMICPSLPQADYGKFSRDICKAIRVQICEHVWAEPLNVRGQSLIKTIGALQNAGLRAEADRLAAVSGPRSGVAWEDYSRATFQAHTGNVPRRKLRYLQYVDEETAGWWDGQRAHGALPLGRHAL